MKHIFFFIFFALFVGAVFGSCAHIEGQKGTAIKINSIYVVDVSTNDLVLLEKINKLSISNKYFSDGDDFSDRTEAAEYNSLSRILTQHLTGNFDTIGFSFPINTNWYSNDSIRVELIDCSMKLGKQFASHGTFQTGKRFDGFTTFMSDFSGADTIADMTLHAPDFKIAPTANAPSKGRQVSGTLGFVYRIMLYESRNKPVKSDTIHFQFRATIALPIN
jgi:hypothetical protein